MESKLLFIMKNLYECFKKRDCLSVSVNPLVITENDQFIAANCKVVLDPNALYR